MVEGDNIYLQLVKFQFLRRHPNMPRTSFRCDPCARVQVKGQRLREYLFIEHRPTQFPVNARSL